MSRLPNPGGDAGQWGQILNEYLSQSHNADGTLKNGIVTSSHLAPNAVNSSNLIVAGGANGQVLTLDSTAPGGFKWATASGSGAQVNADWNATTGVAQILNKPVLGSAAAASTSSFATAAQGAKADSAAQSINGKTPNVSGQVTLTAADVGAANTLDQLSDVTASGPADGQVLAYNSGSSQWIASTVTSTTVSDATSTSKGILQLAGDLGGTAAAPTVPGLATKADVSALANYIPTSQKGVASGVASLDATGKVPSAQLPAAASQQQADWTQSNTGNVDYIKNKPTLASVATSGSYTDLTNKPIIPSAQVNSDWNASSGVAQVLNKPTFSTVATSGSYTDLTNKPTIPSLDPTVGGDLTGTVSNAVVAVGAITSTKIGSAAVVTSHIAASAVTQPKLSTTNSPSASGQLLSWNGSAMTWTAPATRSFYQDKQWLVSGLISVAAGDTDYLCPSYVGVAAGTTATIVGVRARINSGTNATIKITNNGVDLAGLTSIVATTSGVAVTGLSLPLSDGDALAVVVNSTSGSPQNMTVEVVYRVTV